MHSQPFYLESILVEPEILRVTAEGDVISVEPKVMDVLLCLVRYEGQVVSRDTLMSEVWPESFVVDDTLTRCISQLRKLLRDSPSDARCIQTIRSRGYRLIVAPTEEAPRTQNKAPVTESRPTRVPVRDYPLMFASIAALAFIVLVLRSTADVPVTADEVKKSIFIDSTMNVIDVPDAKEFVLIGGNVFDLEASLLLGGLADSTNVWVSGEE